MASHSLAQSGASINNKPKFFAVDKGISLAISHWKLLILFSFVPAVIDIISANFLLFHPLGHREIFIITVLSVLAHAWLMSSVFMIIMNTLKGECPSIFSKAFFSIALRAFITLPKMFFSILGIVIFAVWAGGFLPVLMFGAFMLWAPMFCLAEIYSKDLPWNDENFDEEAYVESIDGKMFTGRFVWEVGYLRSFNFSLANANDCVHIALLFLAATFLPSAVITLLGGNEENLMLLGVEVLFSTAGVAFAMASAAGVFIMLQSEEARREIGLVNVNEKLQALVPRNLSFYGREWTFWLLTILSFVSAYVVIARGGEVQRVPENTKFEIVSAEVESRALTVNFRIIDDEKAFRWLDTKGFMLSDINIAEIDKEKKAEKKSQRISPRRVRVYNEKGNLLDGQRFKPYSGILKIELVYGLDTDVVKEGEFALDYVEPVEEKLGIVRGKFIVKQNIKAVESGTEKEDAKK